jgi:hypothetical protein
MKITPCILDCLTIVIIASALVCSALAYFDVLVK